MSFLNVRQIGSAQHSRLDPFVFNMKAFNRENNLKSELDIKKGSSSSHTLI